MSGKIETWDDQSIADLISDAISDAADMDTTTADYAKAIVANLRAEGLLPSVDGAAATITACCAELTTALAERGYPTLYAEIWCRPGRFTCFVDGKGREAIGYGGDARTLSDLMTRVKKRIAEMPDTNAYDAWFAWPQDGEAA